MAEAEPDLSSAVVEVHPADVRHRARGYIADEGSNPAIDFDGNGRLFV